MNKTKFKNINKCLELYFLNKILTIDEAERITKIPAFYIHRAAKEGLIEFSLHKNEIIVTENEVQLWISKNVDLVKRLQTIPEKFYFKKNSYKFKNKYMLPFKGYWLVGSEHLSHCTRYAWDFIVVDECEYDKCFIGMKDKEILKLKYKDLKDKNPESFLCYGREIIAPEDGKIIFTPNSKELKNETDNKQGLIVIEHENSEYSNLGHILAKSVKVKVGDFVKKGQTICLAGGKYGDGKTQIPHLHWDIWDYTHFLFAKGIPIKIRKALIFNKNKQKNYSFFLQRGMLVSNI